MVILLLLLALAGPAAAQNYNFSAVDQTLQDSLSVLGGTGDGDFGGACLLLWKDGRLIYERSVALPGKTMPKTRLIPIASASKWVSGAVITALLEQGTLRLDDSVAQYIPTAKGDMRRMTIRQLFSFTSGLRGNAGPFTPCVEDVNAKITLAECVDSILAGKLATQPGAFLNYGSEGMHVAGRMAEVASNLPIASGSCWDSLFTQALARPLGWTRTSWDIRSVYDTDNPRIDGGVWSTAEEYMRLLVMILNDGIYDGKRVLGSQWIDSMLADQTRGARIAYSPYMGIDASDANTRYGIGVWRERVDPSNDTLIEGASQGRFGFSPWIDFGRRYCGVLAVKSSSIVDIYPTYIKLKEQIRAALDAVTTVDDEATAGEWTLEGTYDVLGRTVDASAPGLTLRVERNGTRVRTVTVLQ
jgi:CubicO group peptidase (beta-lactamase class C family)